MSPIVLELFLLLTFVYSSNARKGGGGGPGAGAATISDDANGSTYLSTGATIGLVVGCLFATAIIVGICISCKSRRSAKRSKLLASYDDKEKGIAGSFSYSTPLYTGFGDPLRPYSPPTVPPPAYGANKTYPTPDLKHAPQTKY